MKRSKHVITPEKRGLSRTSYTRNAASRPRESRYHSTSNTYAVLFHMRILALWLLPRHDFYIIIDNGEEICWRFTVSCRRIYKKLNYTAEIARVKLEKPTQINGQKEGFSINRKPLCDFLVIHSVFQLSLSGFSLTHAFRAKLLFVYYAVKRINSFIHSFIHSNPKLRFMKSSPTN